MSSEHVESSHWDYFYVVTSKFLLPRYVNTVCTHFSVSEIENTLKLIYHIDKLHTWRYATLSHSAWLCVMLYVRGDFLVYTTVLVNWWEIFPKKELPIYGHYVKEYQKFRAKFRHCVLILLIDQIFVFFNFCFLCGI